MKKTIISLSIIAVMATMAVGATSSYFSDLETSSGNIFSAGTLDLKVGDDDPTTWGFNVENIKPGDSGSDEAAIENIGSIDGYLHITFANLLNDENNCVEPEYTNEPYCDDNIIGELAKNLDLLVYLDENTNDIFDLGTDALIYQGKARGILQGDIFNYSLVSSDSKDFRVEWDLPSSTNNEAQSDKAGFDIVFEITQNQKQIVGNWHFNENSGIVAYDSSGYGNDGALVGNLWTDGQYNPALSFDGVNDYVEVNCGTESSLNLENTVTVEAWVKSSTAGNYDYIIAKYYSGGMASYALDTDSAKARFYVTTGGSFHQVTSNINIWDGNWHHLVGSYDKDAGANNINLYIDNNLVSSGTTTGEMDINPDMKFYIGNYGTGTKHNFPGVIDEVKVYSYALDDTEISERYQTGL